MRVGFNPHKDKVESDSRYLHQVIIPVYIPNEEGYFGDSITIFKYCLQSLFKTCHEKTFFTIVNNGSCQKVLDYCNQLLFEKKIHEIIHTSNIGKLNAVLKGVTGHNIPLVTIADADVLFLTHWQNETNNVFARFPKAGVVGIVPQFKQFEGGSVNVIREMFFSRKLRFTDVKNPLALIQFYKSIGWDDDYNKDYLLKNLTIASKGYFAIVGSGHFVATYRRDLFDKIITFNEAKMGAGSEKYLDDLPLKQGLWRLTTANNHAFHMGNVKESWMEEELKKLLPENLETCPDIKYEKRQKSTLVLDIRNHVFQKLFSKTWFRKRFYKYKGLPPNMISNY